MVESKTERGMENKTKGTAEPEEIIPLRKRLLAELFGTFALVFAVGADAANIVSDHEIGILL